MLTVPALANITTASLTGRVTVGGAPAGGVAVTVASAALQEPRTTLTNAHGRYWLGALPPGEYDVTFSLEGHTTLIRRATLELARVARADATLEANPDEDSVTSTVKTVSVADTLPATSHFDDRLLDRLPTGRLGSASLAPGTEFGSVGLVDGVPSGAVTSEDTVEQITVVRGAAPVEWESFAGAATALRTRSGGEDFFFTLRDTIAKDQRHFGEATIGGRIVPQRLWFFAAAWRGEQAFPNPQELEGSMVKVDAQLGAAHHLDLSYNDTTQSFGFIPFESDTASLRYTGAFGPRFTAEVLAARTDIGARTDFLSGRASYTLGDHVVTAGITANDGEGPDYGSLYASDRWSFSRWNVYAGLRYDDGEFSNRLSPRVAIAYDLRGDGARAITASWGEYALPAQPVNALRFLSLGFASAIGNSGAVRVDARRGASRGFTLNELQLDARYRLFDRIEAGATYTYADRENRGLSLFDPEHVANVWLGAELPVGNHEFGVTLLQRYTEIFHQTALPTDLALRYTIPLPRLTLRLAADVTNAFNDTELPRAARFWVRVTI